MPIIINVYWAFKRDRSDLAIRHDHAIMKITVSIAFCLGILICHSSDAQNTNRTTEVGHVAEEIRNIDLKMDMPGGFGSVLISELPTSYLVRLPVHNGIPVKEYSLPDLSGLGLQVWLLKTDGTSVPQRGKPRLAGMQNAGWDSFDMIYAFDKVPSDELAGIVLRAKGKLYCQEIRTTEK